MLSIRKLDDFEQTTIEVIGAEHTYGPNSRVAQLSREVILRINVHHMNPVALAIFGKEVAPVCCIASAAHYDLHSAVVSNCFAQPLY
jgi:hypothetical protein